MTPDLPPRISRYTGALPPQRADLRDEGGRQGVDRAPPLHGQHRDRAPGAKATRRGASAAPSHPRALRQATPPHLTPPPRLQVRHPFILGLECAFQSASKLHFVTEYVPGGMLFNHLRKQEMFSEKMVRLYALSNTEIRSPPPPPPPRSPPRRPRYYRRASTPPRPSSASSTSTSSGSSTATSSPRTC